MTKWFKQASRKADARKIGFIEVPFNKVALKIWPLQTKRRQLTQAFTNQLWGLSG